jgi:pyridoxal phosphate enzyme (YggS family)
VQQILSGLPPDVQLIAAAKSRTPEEVNEAIQAGIRIIAHNYLQEAHAMIGQIDPSVEVHFIGHLQTRKIKKAVEICDMIQTVDSMKTAEAIDAASGQIGKIMPVLIEVNSGEEPQKHGIFPGEIEQLVRNMAELKHVRILGLMTMGLFSENPEDSRFCFNVTKQCFDQIKSLNLSNTDFQWLSMGMSDSYKVAVEEGANMVRIGTGIFGSRDYSSV